MRWRCELTIILLLAAASLSAAEISPEQFRAALTARYAELKQKKKSAVKGQDGWYFLSKELRSYGTGTFWGEAALKTSVAEEDQDPLPAILDFNAQLKQRKIVLILVPVPGKVCVYGDKLEPALISTARFDEAQQKFYTLLEAEGIHVIDLLPELVALRKNGDAYCHQDSHWSVAAAHLAAKRIAEVVKKSDWYQAVPKKPAQVTAVAAAARGDLVALVGDETEPKEVLALEQVTLGGSAIASDPASPLIVMGDSHVLVYHSELLADHSGLPDLLAGELGLAPDVVAMRGGGANGARSNLAYRKDNLEGKRCIVWCFAAREFTESVEGWQKIPVISAAAPKK